jgi:hypothetical protein
MNLQEQEILQAISAEEWASTRQVVANTRFTYPSVIRILPRLKQEGLIFDRGNTGPAGSHEYRVETDALTKEMKRKLE